MLKPDRLIGNFYQAHKDIVGKGVIKAIKDFVTGKLLKQDATGVPMKWLSKKTRWINVIGVPIHLIDLQCLKAMCIKFGNVEKLEIPQNYGQGPSTIRVLVKENDLTQMPQVMILNDQDFVLPIRFVLDEPDHPAGQGDNYSRPILFPNHIPVDPTISNSNPNHPGPTYAQVTRICSPIHAHIPDFFPVQQPIISAITPNPDYRAYQPAISDFNDTLTPHQTNLHPTDSLDISPTHSPTLSLNLLARGTSNALVPFISKPTPVLNIPNTLTFRGTEFESPDETFSWADDLDSVDPFDQENAFADGTELGVSNNESQVSFEVEEDPRNCNRHEVSFMKLLMNMEEGAAKRALPSEDEGAIEHQPLVQPLDTSRPLQGSQSASKQITQTFQSATEEDDGLVSDSGDESDHLPEEDSVPAIVHDSNKHADFIANKVAEINKLLGMNVENSKMSDPINFKKEKGLGNRSKRRRKRAALLLKAEGKIVEST